MKYREAEKKLRALGCEQVQDRGSGSHRVWFNPKTDRLTTLPDWGRKDLKIGTLRAAIKQLGLEWESFIKA